MFLITSASYITSDLATEYGKIPPTFLPLQNKRLYQHQLSFLKKGETSVISLPLGFEVPENDIQILNKNNVRIIFVPEKLTLGQSIVYVLNVTARYNEPLSILHGDTLFSKLHKKLDTYLIAKTSDNYAWALSAEKQSEDFVYAGFFSFSNQSMLIQCIAECNFDFINGILSYKEKKQVTDEISDNWLDFGHANTYYRSKAQFTTQRFFNNLKIDGFSVIKSSSDKNKMLAEANWFKNVPNELKRYIPALWGSKEEEEKGTYEIEYFYLSSLAELFVYGKNEYFIWQNILNACNDFILECSRHFAPQESNIAEKAQMLYHKKTTERLEIFSTQTGIDINRQWILNGRQTPSITDIIAEINEFISTPSIEQQTIIHGDFGFSNILYDFRKKSIKVIDPRGIDAFGHQTIYGDIRYDIAKLAHSVIGMYDFIIAGSFSYSENGIYNVDFEIYTNPMIKKVQQFFVNNRFAGLNIKEASTFPILIHLFLSMLPLHKDNTLRQKAMLANALRLYFDFKELNKIK